MTFLNPLILFGLAAAAIPILLHIFHLRKLKTIDFSTLSFLKELQKTKIRKLKLRQLLLLLLRTLFILLIVFAFSRPTMKGSSNSALAEQAKTTALILFDDSQSMTASDEQGELLKQAKISAEAVLSLLNEGDEVFLIKLSDIPESGGTQAAPPPQYRFASLRADIKEIKPSSRHRTIEDALRYSAKLLSASKNFNKEVYIISDFQSGSLESKDGSLKEPENLFDSKTQFFFIALGNREPQNIAVTSIEIPNAIFEINKPFTVKAVLTNYGVSDVQNHVVSVFQDGERTAQKGLNIRSHQSVGTEFTLLPKRTGFLQGKIVLEDDDLEFDNSRFFTVHIPREIRILLVGNPSDLPYLRLVLHASHSEGSTRFAITETTWDKLSSLLLHAADVLIFSDVPLFTPGQSAMLQSFLMNGGGALVFPGPQTTVHTFNTSLAGPLGTSKLLAIDHSSEQTQKSVTAFEFDKVDFHHPLFAGMFEKKESKQIAAGSDHAGLESPHISTALRIHAAARAKIIITLSNTNPFLLEERVGTGSLILVGTAANTQWSDFPLKSIFVPLVHRALAYLAKEPLNDEAITAGNKKLIRIRSAAPPIITVKKPDGKDVIIQTQQNTAGSVFPVSETDLTGIYTAASGSTILTAFAVNIHPDESATAPSDKKKREEVSVRLGIQNNSIHSISRTADMQRIVTESRIGRELWKYFLLAALLTAVLEMVVARDKNKTVVS